MHLIQPDEAFGQIFTDDFARASIGASYSAAGTATWACNGSALTVTGGSGVATDRLRRTYIHSFEFNTQVVVAQITSVIGTASLGFGPGYGDLSNPDGERTVFVRLITNNNSPSFGKVVINTFDGTTTTTRATSATALTINQNDIFTFTLVKSNTGNVSTFDITVTRAAGGSINVSWSDSVLCYATARFALFEVGGDWTITEWTVDCTDRRYVKALFVGDSITHGLTATNLSTRWPVQVAERFGSHSISAGAGDVTQRVVDKIGFLIAYRANHVFLMIGGNDILFGVASGTWQANYTSIRNQFKAAGAKITHCLATPRDATNMTTLNTFISGFTSDTVVDTFTPLKGAGTDLAAAYDSGDGVHPNQAGHDLIATTVIASL